MPLVGRLNYLIYHKKEKKSAKLQKISEELQKIKRSNVLSINSAMHNKFMEINLDSLQKPFLEKILLAAT